MDRGLIKETDFDYLLETRNSDIKIILFVFKIK